MEKTEKKLIQPKEAGHWYDRKGNPAYTQPNKSKDGETRPTTIRDARKLDLIPSVTTICNQLAKPGLEMWIKNQILLSAATTPHKRSEMSADDWIQIILEESKEQAKIAREKGILIHADIEKFFRGEQINPANKIRCLHVHDILREQGIEADAIEPEKSFASPLGFGGKMDLPAIEQCFLGDIKTTEFTIIDGMPYKNGKKAKLNWPEHLLQLAGYKFGNFPINAVVNCCNIYVSTIDNNVFCHRWNREEIEMAEQEFKLLLKLWWLKNIPQASSEV